MVTREQIVAEARSWIGTPVRHQGRRKGVSADCKGLAAGVARALGMPEGDSIAANVLVYSTGFHGSQLLDGLRETLIRVVSEPQLGDLLAILWGRDPLPRHLAILTEPGWIVHAYGGHGKIAEVPLGAMRVHSVWTWPSLIVSADVG